MKTMPEDDGQQQVVDDDACFAADRIERSTLAQRSGAHREQDERGGDVDARAAQG